MTIALRPAAVVPRAVVFMTLLAAMLAFLLITYLLAGASPSVPAVPHVGNGLIAFDANGDTTESPVTILRVSHGGGKNSLLSVEGGVVERVVRPSPRLVAPEG